MARMTPHERIEAFWNRQQPDRIPITIYSFFTGNDPATSPWRPLFERGLCPTFHVWTAKRTYTDDRIKWVKTEYTENGKKCIREALQTPVGEIYNLWEEGWQQKHMLVTAEDYKVMTYAVEHTRVEPNYAIWDEMTAKYAPWGVPLAIVGRTPLQMILVDWAGLEQFSMHLYDFEQEVMALYHAQLRVFRETAAIVAGGPGKFVSDMENFTAETMGPARFAELHVPVYKECFPQLQQAGKIVGCHFDGKVASCAKLIAESPIDLMESLTPPPEGDMTLPQCRQAWPDKLFWSNINVSSFELPPEKLKELLYQRIAEGSVDGRLFAFEISEDVPPNWQQSVPVVLDALEALKP